MLPFWNLDAPCGWQVAGRVDPDDILRQKGLGRLRRILSSATGILDSLWASKAAAI